MPIQRRQRKPEPTAVVCSPTKPKGADVDSAAESNPPAASGNEVAPNCDGSARQDADVDKSLLTLDSPDKCSNLTSEDVPSESATPSQADPLKHEDTVKPRQVEEAELSEINYMDPPDNPFKIKAVPDPVQPEQPNGLVRHIQKSRKKAAALRANGDPHLWLTIPSGHTGNPHLDHALDDLRASRYCLWLGDAHRILKNCTWINGEQTYMSTLQWKANAPSKLVHDEGDAIIGFLGMVSTTGLTTGPEGGWQESYGQKKLSKQKRNFRLVYSGLSSNVPQIHWDTQLGGALRLVDDGCKASKSGSHEVTNCFVNKEAGYLRLRSPIFAPGSVVQDDEEDDQRDDSSSVSYEDIPRSCEFATWKLTSEVQEAFERIIEQGFAPQVIEAYDRHDKLIHPNNVTATLSGAIVIVYCTLERMRFPNKNNTRNTEYQFYATQRNRQILYRPGLVSRGLQRSPEISGAGSPKFSGVQVIKNAPPPKPTATVKRKFIRSYGQSEQLEWDDESDGSGPAKKMRLNE
ncbi:hypothetical protein FRC07_006085 [Ceratobasidium sp. 392]|nr:hypothetical protein FRC07_006085 [Ceratobasidium sp. 392]